MKAIELKIKLLGVSPVISRTLLVNEKTNFFDLHRHIQDIFGFDRIHLFEYNYGDEKKIVRPREDDDPSLNPYLIYKKAQQVQIIELFEIYHINELNYTYDFGNNWNFQIKINKIVEISDDTKLPFVSKYSGLMLFENIGGIKGLQYYIDMYKKGTKFPENGAFRDLEEFRKTMEEHYNLEEIFNNLKFSKPRILLKEKL